MENPLFTLGTNYSALIYLMHGKKHIAQLRATFIHYPCTVILPDLAYWSAFLELVLLTT